MRGFWESEYICSGFGCYDYKNNSSFWMLLPWHDRLNYTHRIWAPPISFNYSFFFFNKFFPQFCGFYHYYFCLADFFLWDFEWVFSKILNKEFAQSGPIGNNELIRLKTKIYWSWFFMNCSRSILSIVLSAWTTPQIDKGGV